VPRDKTQATFGQVVREVRTAAGISQEVLAERAALHRTYISLLERGLRNPSLLVIEEISRALNVPMSDMIARVEAMRVRRR